MVAQSRAVAPIKAPWRCGSALHTNGMRQTSVAGVFACGDTSLAAGSVALAVGEGVRAGVGAHFSLISG